MIVKYIDNDYIINELGKTSWGDVEEPDFYIKMASERVKRLIFPSEQGNPNDISTYTDEQQSAIKLATAKYTFWYFDTNYDQTTGSVSVSFGGVSMSESKSYNGETVLPEVYDILQQANLIPTTETFAILNTPYKQDWNKPDKFIELEQKIEVESNNNIRQDNEIRELQDKINRGLSYNGVSPIIVDNISKLISINITEFNKQNIDVFTKQEVLNIVYASGSEWRPDFPYKTGYITQRVKDGKLLYFLALKDSLGIDPLAPDAAEYWKQLETQDIDLNLIVDQVKPYINDELYKIVPAEVRKQIDEIPETDYVQEQLGQNFDFVNEEQFKMFNDANGITGQEDKYWEDVIDENIKIGNENDYKLINKLVTQRYKDNEIKSEIIQHDDGTAVSFKLFKPNVNEFLIKNTERGIKLYTQNELLIKNDNDIVNKKYVDELTDANNFRKYTTTISFDNDISIYMDDFFIKNGIMRQGEFQFVMRCLGSKPISYSWNHVHLPVINFSTVGVSFEFLSSLSPINRTGRWIFNLGNNGWMRIWTNSSAVDNDTEIEIIVRQVGRA